MLIFKEICMSDIYLSTFKYKIHSRVICSLFICLLVGAYLWHHTYCDTDFFRWHTVGDVFFLTTQQGMLGKIKKKSELFWHLFAKDETLSDEISAIQTKKPFQCHGCWFFWTHELMGWENGLQQICHEANGLNRFLLKTRLTHN